MEEMFVFRTPLPREECARRLTAALAGDTKVPSRSDAVHCVPFVEGKVEEDRFEISCHNSESGSIYFSATMLPELEGGTRIAGCFCQDRPRRIFLALFRGFVYVFGFVMIGSSLYGAFKADRVAWPLAFLAPLLFLGFTWMMLWFVRHARQVDHSILLEFLTANLSRELDDPRLPG